MQVNRYQVVSTCAKDLIYSCLAPGLLEKLESLNPANDDGDRSVRNHQYLLINLAVLELSHVFLTSVTVSGYSQ